MSSLFSPLTSKITSALSILLIVLLVYVTVTKNSVIDYQSKTITKQSDTILTLRANNNTLKHSQEALVQGVNACSSSAKLAAEAASRAASTGINALQEAQKGRARVDSAIARLQAMPANGSSPAQLCEQADAILLQGAL